MKTITLKSANFTKTVPFLTIGFVPRKGDILMLSGDKYAVTNTVAAVPSNGNIEVYIEITT